MCCAAADSRHTSRFLVLYVATLPLALVHVFGWATLLVMAIACWALFGILEIGNLIEEPFTGRWRSGGAGGASYILPLTEVCRTIRRDVRAVGSYSERWRQFSVPTIERKPSTSVAVVPKGFREMRQRAAEEAARVKAAQEAAAAEAQAAQEAAAAGGQAYLKLTTAVAAAHGTFDETVAAAHDTLDEAVASAHGNFGEVKAPARESSAKEPRKPL